MAAESRLLPAVRVRNAFKCFPPTRALNGVSFELNPGEWLGLLGPNGAGKTTLMQCIVGLLRLDEGGIELFGRSSTGRSGADRGRLVGFVPQEIALYPLLTVEENLAAFGTFHGLRGQELRRRIKETIRWTDLGQRAGDKISALSGGMKRRLNIACSVLHRPRIVLLDEPTVGVDPHARMRIFEMLGELRNQGVALIHSTHELHGIDTLCDRMLIIDCGRVVADGTVDELIRHDTTQETCLQIKLDTPIDDNGMRCGIEAYGNTLRGAVRDVATELPAILEDVRRRGGRIRGLRIEAPGIEDVFERLTGRGLRE